MALERSTLSIEQLSHSLGFRDPAHFSHFHKRMTGLAPGKFRKMLGSAANTGDDYLQVKHLRVVCGSDGQSADLTLIVDGQEKTASTTGDIASLGFSAPERDPDAAGKYEHAIGVLDVSVEARF